MKIIIDSREQAPFACQHEKYAGSRAGAEYVCWGFLRQYLESACKRWGEHRQGAWGGCGMKNSADSTAKKKRGKPFESGKSGNPSGAVLLVH